MVGFFLVKAAASMVTAVKTARMVVDKNSGTTMVSCSALSARAITEMVHRSNPKLDRRRTLPRDHTSGSIQEVRKIPHH